MTFRKKTSFRVLSIAIILAFLTSCASGPKNTRLHNYIIENDSESAKKEALSTKDINGYDKFGRTALHLAVLKNNKELVKFLITNGADINCISYCGYTPLSLSMRHDGLEIAIILMEAGAEINTESAASSPLIEAIKFKRADMAKKLMENGADVNTPDKNNATALYYASFFGLNDVLNELFNRGVDLNTRTYDDMSPMHAAAFNEKKEIVKTLISRNAGIYPVEKSEKGQYSTAMLYLYAAEIYESNGQIEEAISAYKRAMKYNELVSNNFRDRDGEIKWKGIKRRLFLLGGFIGFASVGYLMIPVPCIPVNIDTTKLNFYSEETNFLVSGYFTLYKTHPEFFEIKKNEPLATGGTTVTEANNSYKCFSTIQRQIYRGLSEKCVNQAEQCSSKMELLANNSKNKSFANVINEKLPSLKEMESVGGNDSDGYVNLYIYQKYRFVGSAARTYFFIDNSYYAHLNCNKYLVKKTKPGTHTIKISYGVPELNYIKFFDQKTINIEKGHKDYFVEMIHGSENTMSVATKETAEKEMKTMVLTDAIQNMIFE